MIETEQLQLLPCELGHLAAFLQSRQALADLLKIEVPASWPHFPEAIPYIYQLLREQKQTHADTSVDTGNWDMYFFVHKKAATLIGSGGFKGAPDAAGMVEIGYEIVPEFRGQGLATEAAQGLLSYAFWQEQASVNLVQAHTLAEVNHSTKVLQKLGMSLVKIIQDPEDGALWLWQIRKQEFTLSRK